MEQSLNGAAEILRVLKFDHFKQVSLGEEIVVYSIFFIIVGLVIHRLNKYLKKEKDKKTKLLKQDYKEKEKLTFQTIIANLKLLPHEYQLLEKISGSSTFKKNYSIIESVKRFESRVEHFKQTQNSAKILSQIYQLRHKLGFHYENAKIPFICTQMLAVKARLECSIQVGHKPILFISPIVNISENYLYIKPPTNHKKPVNLKPFSWLNCKIRRPDGIYEFRLPIIRQVFGENNHIVLGHTKDIRKIVEREFERFPVHLFSTLYKISGPQVNLPKKELQHLKEEETLPLLDGEITNISLGGMHFVARGDRQTFWEREFVMFTIPGVHTRNDLQAQILTVTTLQGKFQLHLKFFHLTDVERLKLNKFLLRLKSNSFSRQTKKTDSQSHEILTNPESL